MAEATTTGFTVKQSIEIEAPRERVWELLTDPEKIARWMPMTRFEARVGGGYDFVSGRGEWHATGEVTEVDPPRLIAYTWDWLNAPIGADTEVRFELEEKGAGTVVHLTHLGFPSEESQGNHAHGWTHYAERLTVVAEGGDPGPDTMMSD